MFRVRRVYDDVSSRDARAIARAKELLHSHFRGIARRDIERLPAHLRNPIRYRFRAVLFVVEDGHGEVRGAAVLLHEPVLKFCYLEFIAVASLETGQGIGGALYERVRQEALDLNTMGIFFECLPDAPSLSRDPVIRKQNVARLRFYERYGARPIANTAYETPLKKGDDNPPYLCFDDLGQNSEVPRDSARVIVRTILERKYGKIVTPEYVNMVVESFKDDPMLLRAPRYTKKAPLPPKRVVPLDKRILLTVNERHVIHHVEETGYVESPARVEAILNELKGTGFFHLAKPGRFSDKHVEAAHGDEFLSYLKKVCSRLDEGESVYPYVFPIRNRSRPPKDLPMRAGYYCIDTFTPLTHNAYIAARGAVDCALTCARHLVEGGRLAYALVRPPGHHAERASFGGFCYLNSAAIAAEYLSRAGKVAILDIDHHHGNGQQDIFYRRADVLTISIHGHPRDTFPFFTGYADERGEGEGDGFNLNFPLPEGIDGAAYRRTLTLAIRRVARFRPRFLVVPLGLDAAREDPTGSWSLDQDDFEAIGKTIGSLNLPLLAVQEGGYDTRVIGTNARRFFTGLWSAVHER